jgi:hypothetical protein
MVMQINSSSEQIQLNNDYINTDISSIALPKRISAHMESGKLEGAASEFSKKGFKRQTNDSISEEDEI